MNDRCVGRSIERYGDWSPGETALFRQFCRPGHYVVDVVSLASVAAVARPAKDPRPNYQVTVVRLDDFYDQPRLDFIEIDVEGMEADVLRGAAALIRRHKPVIYAENDRPEKSPEYRSHPQPRLPPLLGRELAAPAAVGQRA